LGVNTAALIVAAGKGERAGGDIPKQFQSMAGKPLIAHSVAAFASHQHIKAIYIVIADGQEDILKQCLGDYNYTAILGGKERQDSVLAGLNAIQKAGDYDAVLIHDAARPTLPHVVIDALLQGLETHDGAVPVLPVVDTLARANGALAESVDREHLYRIQTPQAFRLPAIIQAHKAWRDNSPKASPATDDAQMARMAGFDVMTVKGDNRLEKITHFEDFQRMEAMINAEKISRTGMGYDVHRLEPGKQLWLCGVNIPHDRGLSGHSDADVALHALTDALLGAIGEGDIGTHFPPSDPQWKGAASHRFLEHARDLIKARGGVIDHVDVTIICEAPKIGPHRDAMRQGVAQILGLNLSQVSIKATTTERLGFTGREEGIAAQAIATVRV
jgi:2-C-methyl-D-erythritol 4-phosphate cytidylyltransferase / 2-C-methyl-D-erythritol 2,4-cyclodiphosphate synthase